MKFDFFSPITQELKQELREFDLINFKEKDDSVAHFDKVMSEKYFSEPFGVVVGRGDDHSIVARLSLFEREVKFETSQLHIGGIGTVCVRLGNREHGIGTALVEAGLKVLKERGFDLALLCTDIQELGRFYGAAGFVKLPLSYTCEDVFGNTYLEKAAMIAPLNSPELFDKILNSATRLHLGRGNW